MIRRHTVTSTLPLFFLAIFFSCCITVSAEQPSSPYTPVYHILLRVHLGESARQVEKWKVLLGEINTIWFSQAGICFDMQLVEHDTPISDGLDLWFEENITGWNGYYTDHHDMHVRDDPDLKPADNPANSSAARTAAHELGHALNLRHRQDSDDNLMRSKTYGWKLHQDEINIARENAKNLAVSESDNALCTIRIHNNP